MTRFRYERGIYLRPLGDGKVARFYDTLQPQGFFEVDGQCFSSHEDELFWLRSIKQLYRRPLETSGLSSSSYEAASKFRTDDNGLI